MNNLVFMHGLNEEPYTTDKIISECSNNNLHSVKVIIYNHKEDLEEFGVLSFEMTKPVKGSKGGRPQWKLVDMGSVKEMLPTFVTTSTARLTDTNGFM